MKDPSTAIRIAVTAALSGILYDNKEVPIYDDMAPAFSSFPRIILQDVTGGGDRDSKCGFGGDWSQVIKVSTSFAGRVSKNPVEFISNEITQRLAPATGPFIDLSPEFSVWNTQARVNSTPSYSDGSLTYIDRNITITYSLTEI